MTWQFSWWLVLPALLCVLYGYTESRIKDVLHLSTRSWANWLPTALVAAAATLSWPITAMPLPLFYLLAYLCLAVRYLDARPVPRKNWFLLNLCYANTLTLHLIWIGLASLIKGVTMRALLGDAFWRTMSVCAVLSLHIAQDFIFLRRPDFSTLLASQAESEEAGPFMAFLWFCAGYLLIDSTLCVFELEPFYPPLFLIGSSAAVMFVLIRFLVHINALILENHLKEEHGQLASRLEAARESADALKNLAEKDMLTGVFSRRFVMKRISGLIEANAPFSLAFLDLDGLKRVNDTQGHDAGDCYLIRFASALEARLGGGGTLARVGGDEFLVLLPGCGAQEAASRLEAIRGALEQEGQGEGAIRFSYGVASFTGGAGDADLLMQEADRAMYQDKVRRREGGRR